MKNMENIIGDVAMSDEEMEESIAAEVATRRVGSGIGILIGVGFMLLGIGVQFFPITCSILGLVVYILFEIVFTILTLDFLSLSGWIRRIGICGALGKAFMDSMNARYYNQMMEAKRQAGR